MSIARSVLLRASKSQWLADQVTHRTFTRRAVRRFMPGERLEDAIAAGRALAGDRLGVVLTQLGEELTSLAEAEQVRDHYLGVFDQIRAAGLTGHVSVKPTQLGLNLSPDACEQHLFTLAAKSDTTGIDLYVDMEESAYVDRTLALYRALKAKHRLIGLALQSCLRRTPGDLETLWPLQPRIRLVKGAYLEPADIAFPDKADVDRAYAELGGRMLERAARGECHLIIGSHDLPLVRQLVDRAREHGATDQQYEIHMLYGIRSDAQRELAAEGRTVKTLISYGAHWFRWYMRRLAERPANVLFVAKSLLG
jgi:proline dehydrogenase